MDRVYSVQHKKLTILLPFTLNCKAFLQDILKWEAWWQKDRALTSFQFLKCCAYRN